MFLYLLCDNIQQATLIFIFVFLTSYHISTPLEIEGSGIKKGIREKQGETPFFSISLEKEPEGFGISVPVEKPRHQYVGHQEKGKPESKKQRKPISNREVTKNGF